MSDLEKQMAELISPITRNGAGKTVKTEDLLAERATTHGDYGNHARITQNLKVTLYSHYTDKHTVAAREALEMIAHKIGRILAGDPDFRDHWDDIAGYAKLVADRCTK